jgi:hypothetical protein
MEDSGVRSFTNLRRKKHKLQRLAGIAPADNQKLRDLWELRM